MNITVVKNILTRATGRSGLLLQKHSPELLMVVGVAGVVTSAVLACRATLKVDTLMDETNEKLEKINAVHEGTVKVSEEYTEKDYKKDLAVVRVQTAVNFVKLYGPAVTLGAASIACLLGAHGIMKKRNVALVAAYKAIEQSFSDYRKRVVDEFGSDKDRMLKNGIKRVPVTVTETDTDGKKTETVVVGEAVNPQGISEYARFFDNTNINWNDLPDYNITFLKCQQNMANDLLHSRGHIFLNEVYDMLGFKRTKAGSVVGWVNGEGDDYVDFGLYDGYNEHYRNDMVCDTVGEERRDFVNGYKQAVLLDFNVAGVIYDMI